MIQRKRGEWPYKLFHESMGPGWDQTRDPWICRQTRICCQTSYRLRYAARYSQLVNMLISLEPHGIFGSNSACLFILTLLSHWCAKR